MPRVLRRGNRKREDRPLSELTPEELVEERDRTDGNHWLRMKRKIAARAELMRRFRARMRNSDQLKPSEIRFWRRALDMSAVDLEWYRSGLAGRESESDRNSGIQPCRA